MNLFKLISNSEYIKKFISLFLILFSTGNILNTKADANIYMTNSKQGENNSEEFYYYDPIRFDKYDQAQSQLKMFFGVDPENPGISFYQDSLIIDYSNYVREMYRFKLNDMTIKI